MVVRVEAVALNPIDYKRSGIPYAGWGLNGTPVAQDFSGTVMESTGPEFAVGDAVYGRCPPFGSSGGCLAEFCAPDVKCIARKPLALTHSEAAGLVTAGLSALQALRRGGVLPGSRVLVVGASGGCGLAGVQIARILAGPDALIGAVCSAQSAAVVRDVDAAAVLGDYRDPTGLGAPGSALAAAAPFDCLFDTVSSADPGDGLNGQPYDVALARLLRPASDGAGAMGAGGRVRLSFVCLQCSLSRATLTSPPPARRARRRNQRVRPALGLAPRRLGGARLPPPHGRGLGGGPRGARGVGERRAAHHAARRRRRAGL